MSAVVHTSSPAEHVLAVELADRNTGNLLSRELVTGLAAAVDSVRGSDIRAVVVHGYDSFFCTGGTQDELRAIVEGRLKFDDVPLYRMFLDCEVPVIAAMQGHALGGGLAMGMFADVAVLSEESVYAANFMKYGFTPGMGATYILPLKLGPALAWEMLLTARNYRGSELRQRGVGFAVLKRSDVIAHAIKTAKEMAEKPRESLVLLKRNLTARIVAELPAAVAAEIEMHKTSFALPQVRERIETMFRQ